MRSRIWSIFRLIIMNLNTAATVRHWNTDIIVGISIAHDSENICVNWIDLKSVFHTQVLKCTKIFLWMSCFYWYVTYNYVKDINALAFPPNITQYNWAYHIIMNNIRQSLNEIWIHLNYNDITLRAYARTQIWVWSLLHLSVIACVSHCSL